MDDCHEWYVNWDFGFGMEQKDWSPMHLLDEQISLTDGNVFACIQKKERKKKSPDLGSARGASQTDGWSEPRKTSERKFQIVKKQNKKNPNSIFSLCV